jgi:DNA-binding GntR family transcriptional regulator
MTERTTYKWNLRVIYHNDLNVYALHEVHYKDGQPIAFSKNAISLDFFESVTEIDDYIDKLKRAVIEPVLTIADFKKITEINEA